MDRSLHVLLLDNLPADCERIEMELRQGELEFTGLRIHTKDEFREALCGFHPDVILAESNLPQFPAVEALRMLRDLDADTPMIIVTGSHSEEDVVAAMREGADDYIHKASLKRLPSAIRNALKKRDAERERQLTEAAFRRSREQYRLIAENTRDLVCLLDLDLRCLFASPSYHSVLGLLPQHLLSESWLHLLHADDVKVLDAMLKQSRVTRQSHTAELRLRHTDGTWRYFESVVNYIFDEQGQPEHALIVSRDITDRREAEAQIRRLAAFVSCTPNPVFEFGPDGRLVYYNDAALGLANSLGRKRPEEILPINTLTVVKMCLSTGQNRLRYRTLVKGRTLSWSFFPVPSNRVVHCFAEDITESQSLEMQLRQVQKMESVGQLASGVAHDFNNILTVIQGHAGLVQTEAALPPRVLDSIRQISLAAERASNLTRQLLTFSRRSPMQPRLINLNEVVDNMTKMVRTLVGEQTVLKRTTSGELPPIYADPGMIEQVLLNLAANARDAMPKGGTVWVHTATAEIDEAYVHRRPEARPGYFVVLSVRDTGAGMDEPTLSRIFEPFFTTKGPGRGTGLGLATVYGIVKQHLGWIEVESQVGQGSSFTIHLPASTKAAARPLSANNDEVRGGAETILVVEDEISLRELVREILRKKGYTILEADSGPQALEIWQEHRDRIDLLLTDIMMPLGISGYDLAGRVLNEKPHLKVLYTSGYSIDTLNLTGMINEGNNFLQKPYQPELLAEMVRKCLDA